MPSTIPYDPSLVLGSIVDPKKLLNIVAISNSNAVADAAEATLNAFISLKRSLDMTILELDDMMVPTKPLKEQLVKVNSDITDAANDYATAKLNATKEIQQRLKQVSMVSESVESPIDYNRSQIKRLPISTDSMQMNCQYFSNDNNTEGDSSHASNVASFVSDSLDILGESQSSQASFAASQQVNSQVTSHDIAGTLVVCITCTHKNAQIFAPFILDVDKAVRTWNVLHPDDMIKTNDPASIRKSESDSDKPDEKSFSILSGATYGSSFVGMVHILNITNTESSQSMESIATSLQETFEIGGWFASGTGGFGVSGSFSDSAKNLLSTQNIQSHCSLITMGIIASIKSNAVATGVKTLQMDPQESMQQLAALQGATASENNSISASADAARTGQQMISLKNSSITASLSSLADLDKSSNNIIDTNSMMTALQDYIDRCVAGGDNVGVPINYYLKPITKSMIAQAWTAKYFPNKFNLAGGDDDSKNGVTGNNSSSGSSNSGTSNTSSDSSNSSTSDNSSSGT